MTIVTHSDSYYLIFTATALISVGGMIYAMVAANVRAMAMWAPMAFVSLLGLIAR